MPRPRSTLRGNKAGASFAPIVVDEKVSFRCAAHEMDGDEENFSLLDGNEAVEAPVCDFQYVEDTVGEYELVTQPAVHGTTVLALAHCCILHGFTIVSIVSTR